MSVKTSFLTKTVVLAALAVATGYATTGGISPYPENIEEGFIYLFDGQTFLGWEGETEFFSGEFNPQVGYMGSGKKRRPFCSDGYAMCYTPGTNGAAHAMYTKKEYGDFVLRFCYLVSTNAKRWPGPIPAIEQLELQCHGDPLEFRNIFIREL